MSLRRLGPWLVTILLLTACNHIPPTVMVGSETPEISSSTIPSQPSPATMVVTSTPTLVPTISIPTLTTQPETSLCSPLQDITLAQLPEILQGPLQTPHPGQDDGHHGDDFAFYRFGSHNGMEGLSIQSVLAGTVAGVTSDRLPYGNMVMIETPLEQVPAAWQMDLKLPTPSPAMTPDPRMENCPVTPLQTTNLTSGRSLYLLYAHLRQPSPVKPGDLVSCGQPVGEVGNTGLSGNPHLHLEVRIGPSGARFPGMAYYDPRAKPEEFASYCTWRVSQLFQLLDPLQLLEAEK